MTSTTPAEHDPFFQLLTEALRAGPGSPQWGEAVAKLRDGGVEGADEYRLIIRAREDIELGRDFRKVSAGPGFTRKVLDAVEQEGARRKGIPTATIVAIIAGMVMLAVILVGIVLMSGDGTPRDNSELAIEKLAATSFPVAVASGSLPGALNGFETVQATPSTSSSQPSAFSRVTTTQALDPPTAAVIECELVVPPRDSSQIVSLFVVGSPGPTADLSLNYSDGRASVDISGKSVEPLNLGAPGGTLRLSIRLDRDFVIMEAGGRRLFAGPHGLGTAPRHAGVRFRDSLTDPADKVQLKSITVAQAAPPAEGR